MAETPEYRAVSYWPHEEQRIVFTVRRTPETDAMTDAELIERYGPKWESLMRDNDGPAPA